MVFLRTLNRRRGVIVFNANYVPKSEKGPFPFGVVHYVIEVARILKQENALDGFICYKRCESLEKPVLIKSDVLSTPSFIITMNFNMCQQLVAEAFAKAAALLAATSGHPPGGQLLYLQTNVLLPFIDRETPTLTTHHGPFANHLTDSVGSNLAVSSYANGEAKYRFLLKFQKQGLNVLATNSKAMAAEISFVQERLLEKHGVSPAKITRLPPPLVDDTDDVVLAQDPRMSRILSFLEKHTSALHLATAVARLDEFKNIGLVVESAVELMKKGRDICVMVIGGKAEDPDREHLKSKIPEEYSDLFFFIPKVSKPMLRGVFALLKGRGLFVCTSRYETCGFTPLEAAGLGVCTLVPDRLHQVDLSNRFSETYRYEPNVPALVARLAELEHRREVVYNTSSVANKIRKDTHVEAFRAAFLEMWDDISGKLSIGQYWNESEMNCNE